MNIADAELVSELDKNFTRIVCELKKEISPLWKSEFSKNAFTQCPGILPGDALKNVGILLQPILDRIAQPVEMRHETHGLRSISDGFRLRRVDPGSVEGVRTKSKLDELFYRLGLTKFGKTLGLDLGYIVNAVAGPHEFEKFFFQIYQEGDYISGHTDYHMGDRLDAQFIINHNGVCGVRTLKDGFWKITYDMPGAMNLLGPKMWHEIPPLMQINLDSDPVWRMGLCFRYLPKNKIVER